MVSGGCCRAQIQKKQEKMAVKGATKEQMKLVELSTPDVVFRTRMLIEGRATRCGVAFTLTSRTLQCALTI